MSSSHGKKGDHESSANQFQEKLHSWLKDQGVVSELKSHLRMQLVSALQDGTAFVNRQVSISPKIQALTVLIADFFLQQGYNFSLSVLTTEVPLIGQIFGHLSQTAIKEALDRGRLPPERFSTRDVEDILETLGVPPGCRLHAETLSVYEDSANTDSLLVCLVRSLSSLNASDKSKLQGRMSMLSGEAGGESVPASSPAPDGGQGSDGMSPSCCDHHRHSHEAVASVESPDVWVQEMHSALAQNNLTLCQIDELQSCMKRMHEAEILRVREEEAAKYSALIEEKRKRYEEQERFFSEWQQKVRDEMQAKEERLREVANELVKQHNDVKDKLAALEAETASIKQQEEFLKEKMNKSSMELEAKKSELDMEKADIESAYERLMADREAVERDRSELDLSRKRKEEEKEEGEGGEEEKGEEKQEEEENKKKMREKLVHELAAKENGEESKEQAAMIMSQLDSLNVMKLIQEQCKGILSSTAHAHDIEREDKSLQTVLPNWEAVRGVDADPLSSEDEEKAELKERVIRQQRRIEELTARAAELANQLQDALTAVQLIQAESTPAPLPVVPSVRLFPRPAWPAHMGSGEETNFSERLPNSISRATQASRMGSPSAAPPAANHVPSLNASHSAAASLQRKRENRRRVQLPLSSDIFNSSDESTSTEEMIAGARQRLRRLENESSDINQTYHELRLRLAQDTPALSHPEQNRNLNPFECYRLSIITPPIIPPRSTHARNCTVRSHRPTFDPSHPGYSPFQNVIDHRRPLTAFRSLNNDYVNSYHGRDRAVTSFNYNNSLAKQALKNSFIRDRRLEMLDSSRNDEAPHELFANTQEEQGLCLDEAGYAEIESALEKHESLRVEIDEKISKRKAYLKKKAMEHVVGDKGEGVAEKGSGGKLLKLNKTVTVSEDNNETWYATKGTDDEDRTTWSRHLRCELTDQNEGTGTSNTCLVHRIEGTVVGERRRRSSDDDGDDEMNDDIIKINRRSDVDDNLNDVIKISDSQDSSDSSRKVDSIIDKHSIKSGDASEIDVQKQRRRSPRPRKRSPSSLVSRAVVVGFGSKYSSQTASNSSSPVKSVVPGQTNVSGVESSKLNANEELDTRVSSFLQMDLQDSNNLLSCDQFVTSGEPDRLPDKGSEKVADSVGRGEVSEESSKILMKKKNNGNVNVVPIISGGDPWREPGDGTDFKEADSDDPVSVGTQESSPANSSW